LLSSRFRVIVPEMLGTGDSEKPVGVSLGLVAQARYVRELLEALGVDRYAVIGHSVGGGVAQLLALDHEGVDAMVLMSSTAFDAWPTMLTREIQRTPPEQQVELFVQSGIRASLRIGMAEPDRITPDQVTEYLRPWSGPENVAAFFRFAAAMDGTGLADREKDLGKLEIPVLIFWGEEDEFYPPAIAERLNAAIATSTLGLLPGCRHFLVEDAIETIGPMIYEYLRARYLQEPHGGHGDAAGIVTIQLERRPPWVDLAEYEEDAWHDVNEEGKE
jgi:pimeloyl-ACP methyl ester carboxylesterase